MNRQPYFYMPQHIVLIGASERPHSLGERILTSLLGSAFEGKITPVNLHHKTVAGLKAYPNLNKIQDPADLVIAVTPPESYEALFKACRKKQFRHLLLIQDWEALPEESWEAARQALRRHHDGGLSISVSNPAGVQLPAQGLNAGVLPDFPAGRAALLTGQAAVSSAVGRMLRRMHQGVSRHISLNYALSPTCAADWINRFGHNRHTRVAVIHHNPLENQRAFFSAVRHFARHTPVILHCTHDVGDTERAVLESLSRHCNFLLTLDGSALEAALHARLSDLEPSSRLTVLSDTPIAWLQRRARRFGIHADMPSEKNGLQEGFIGSTPTAAHYRSAAVQQLQQNHVPALLAVVTADDSPNDTAVSRVLDRLAQQTGKPLMLSSPVSDGLLRFDRPEQALQTLHLRNVAERLQQLQNETAPPKPGRLKTVVPDKIRAAAAQHDCTALAKALHLPPCRSGEDHPLATFSFRRHPRYGFIIEAADKCRTIAALPPFTTLDTARLLHFADAKRYQKEIGQFVHSMNTLAQNPETWDGEIMLHIGSREISSSIKPEESQTETRSTRPSETKTNLLAENPPAQTDTPPKDLSDGLNQKMQAAAELLRQGNALAGEFIRSTGGAAAGLWHNRNTPAKPVPAENVLAPYPAGYPQHITLPDGQTVSVRPFEPEDAQAKQQFVRSLSPQSRYTRFMTATNELPQPTLARFSKPDYHSEGAWIAENSDGLIVAVSRFSRLNRDECEFGITVAESMRGSGLALEMMQLIIRLATQQGYRIMSAEILKENTAMLKLAEKSGFSVTQSEQDKALYQAKLDLSPPPQKDKRKFRQ